MDSQKKLPLRCPSCSSALEVSELHCPACDTRVSGSFPLPALARLSEREQAFALDFIRSSGSLKEMARRMNLSYPTVRNLLDDLIEQLNQLS